jgi:hypothetical protein
MTRNITDLQAYQYAQHLAEEHMANYPGILIHENAVDYFDIEDESEDLTTEDFEVVRELINNARVMVTPTFKEASAE